MKVRAAFAAFAAFSIVWAAGACNDPQQGSLESITPSSDVSSAATSWTGVWTGPITFGSTVRVFTFAFYERSEGRLVGYLLGGTTTRYVAYATVVDDTHMTFILHSTDAQLDQHPTVELELDPRQPDRLVGTVEGAGQVVLQRLTDPIVEERFLMVTSESDSVGAEVSAVMLADANGKPTDFLSGGFVGYGDLGALAEPGCFFLGCSGALDERSVEGSTLRFVLSSSNSCPPAQSWVEVSPVGATPLTGTYHFEKCDYVRDGELNAFLRASTTGVLSFLAALAAPLDALEKGELETMGAELFAADYLHDGRTASDAIADLVTRFGGRAMDLVQIQHISTAARSELDVAHGKVPGATFLFAYTDAVGESVLIQEPQLEYFELRQGRWLLVGNGRYALGP